MIAVDGGDYFFIRGSLTLAKLNQRRGTQNALVVSAAAVAVVVVSVQSPLPTNFEF